MEAIDSGHRTTTYSDTDLYRGVTRHYRAAARNNAATGPFSAVKSATTTGTRATASSAPTLFRVSNVARGRVTLERAAPVDDDGAPVSGYQDRHSLRKPCADDPDRICDTEGDATTTTSTSARIIGLTNTGFYSFNVRAVKPIGWREFAGAQANLVPSSGAAVRVSPASVTVDEGLRSPTR